jgi:predicted enzyme related to lactoylglutathione lyase
MQNGGNARGGHSIVDHVLRAAASLPALCRDRPRLREAGWELDVLCVPDKSAELDGRCRSGAGQARTVADMDWKIELVAIPVTDVDRAKAFYTDQVGFDADHDYQVTETLRFVQLTPPGSACSIVMGTGVTEMPPGSQKGVQVVVADVEAARQQLIANGVTASDVDVQPWGSFVYFSDPDGNTWALQQVPPRP